MAARRLPEAARLLLLLLAVAAAPAAAQAPAPLINPLRFRPPGCDPASCDGCLDYSVHADNLTNADGVMPDNVCGDSLYFPVRAAGSCAASWVPLAAVARCCQYALILPQPCICRSPLGSSQTAKSGTRARGSASPAAQVRRATVPGPPATGVASLSPTTPPHPPTCSRVRQGQTVPVGGQGRIQRHARLLSLPWWC